MQYPTVQELLIGTALAWGALGAVVGFLVGVAVMAPRTKAQYDEP